MRSFLVLCALFGLYSQISVSVGGTVIPNILGLSAGLTLLGLNATRMQISHLKAMLAVIGVAFLSVLIAPEFSVFLPSRILALAQLILSMLAGYGFYLELRKDSAERATRMFLWFCAIILAGSAMEAFTPLRGAITSVTALFFDFDFEQQLLRDLNIAGFARPTFITSEPSHVAKGIIIFSISALILNPTRKMMYWAAGLQLLGLIVIRSPSIVIGLAMIFIVYYFSQRSHLQRFERSRRSLRFFVLIMVIGVPVAAAGFVLLSDRIAQVLSGNDFSTAIRLFAGINVGLEAAMRYPISGVGLGGFAAVRELIIEALVDSGVPSVVAAELWNRQLNNGIGTHLLYFGFILLPFYLVLLYRLLDRLSAGNGTMVMLIMFCFCFLTGGVYSPRFVIYFFLFAAVAHLAFRTMLAKHDSDEKRSDDPSHPASCGMQDVVR